MKSKQDVNKPSGRLVDVLENSKMRGKVEEKLCYFFYTAFLTH